MTKEEALLKHIRHGHLDSLRGIDTFDVRVKFVCDAMQEYADQEKASLKSKYDTLGLDYSDLQNRNTKLVEETASLRKELEELKRFLSYEKALTDQERAKSAKLVEALKLIDKCLEGDNYARKGRLRSIITEAIAEYEGKGGGNG